MKIYIFIAKVVIDFDMVLTIGLALKKFDLEIK